MRKFFWGCFFEHLLKLKKSTQGSTDVSSNFNVEDKSVKNQSKGWMGANKITQKFFKRLVLVFMTMMLFCWQPCKIFQFQNPPLQFTSQ